MNDVLSRLESYHDVEILFAVEYGSRAWGLSHPDSDFDVRFVYRRSVEHYLSPFKQHKDVVEGKQGNLDYHGWDLWKMVVLLQKSNPSLYEWCMSGKTYRDGALLKFLRENVGQLFSSRTLAAHYGSLAKCHYHRYLLRQTTVSVKNLLYFIRAVGQLVWIKEVGELPPVNLSILMLLLTDTPLAGTQLSTLVKMKRQGVDTINGSDFSTLVQWATKQYRDWSVAPEAYGTMLNMPKDKYNTLFFWAMGDKLGAPKQLEAV